MILAIDPGKDKCGVAVMENWGEVLEKTVVGRANLTAEILRVNFRDQIGTIVIGESANGRAVAAELKKFGLSDGLVFVSEKETTRLARERYWQANPPRGWLKFIPTSFRSPPAPVDDFAAVIIGERYLATLPQPN